MKSNNRIRPFALLALISCCAVCLAYTVRPTTPTRLGGPPTRCDVNAYVIDKDPNGLNVRSGPSKDAKVIGVLPNQSVEGVVVHITGAADNWLQIDTADEVGGETDRSVFHGQGWVFAGLLGVSGIALDHGGTDLYATSSMGAKVIGRIPGGDDSVKLRSCDGKWFKVEYKGMTGWAAPGTLCANPLTTCS